MPGRRSTREINRRSQRYDQIGYANRLISQHAISTKLDDLGNKSYHETINSQTPGQVAAALQREYNTFDLGVINRIHQGTVLSNTFGEGAHDPKMPKPDDLVVRGWEP